MAMVKTEFAPTVFVQKRYVLEKPQENERVRLNTSVMREIPPGASPFNHDSVSMGVAVVNNWMAMFESTKPNTHIDLYNTDTGQAFRINIEAEEPRLRKVISIGHLDEKQPKFQDSCLYLPEIEDLLVVAFHDAMLHQKIKGIKADITEMYVCVQGRLLVSCDLIVNGTSEQIEELVNDNVFDDDKVTAIVQQIFNLKAYVNRRGDEGFVDA